MDMGKKRVMRAGLWLLGLLPGWSPAGEEVVEVLTYLEPYRSIEISPVETGVIQEIHVKEGQRVAKGDKLISLDSDVIEARLEIARTLAKAEGRLRVAQAEVDLQQDRYDKLLPLVRSGTSSSTELARQSAALKQAQGNQLMAQEEIKTAEIQARQIEAELRRRILVSPIDGTVAEITKDIAEPVSATQINQDSFLIRVVQLDRLKCLGHLPAPLVTGLQVGDVLKVKLGGRGGETLVEGTVEFIAPIIDPATATVRVRLVLENSEGALRSGATAQILAPGPKAQ